MVHFVRSDVSLCSRLRTKASYCPKSEKCQHRTCEGANLKCYSPARTAAKPIKDRLGPRRASRVEGAAPGKHLSG
jgi:hypothetical protein